MINHIELELYMASNDSYSSIMFNGSLADYIQQEQIEFELY